MADHAVLTLTGAAINAALASATWGDTVTLTAGATYVGTVTFPVKTGYTGTKIKLRSTPHASLPVVNQRFVAADHASLVAKIQPVQQSGFQNEGCVKFAPGAEGYELEHIEFMQSYAGSAHMVTVGDNDVGFTLKAHQPRNITIRACFFNGNSTNPYYAQKRGIAMHGISIELADCCFENIGSPSNTTDSQCVWLMNGKGPFVISNNKFEGPYSYALMSGGSVSLIKSIGLVNASPAPTTTSCNFTITNGGDPPIAGDTIGFHTQSGLWREHPTILTVVTTGANTYTITYAATNDAPDVGGDIRFGVVPGDLTFEDNYCTRNPDHVGTKVLPTPVADAPTTGAGGSLTAGTYNVRVAGSLTAQGTLIHSDASASQAIVVSASGKIDVSWTASAGAESYRVYVQHPDLTWRYKTVTGATSTSYTVNGTSGTPPTGNRWAIKCCWEVKCVKTANVRRNIFENSWIGIDSGYALWIKCSNQSSQSYAGSFLETTNVTIEDNIIRNCPGFFSLSGHENESNDNGKRPKGLDGLIIRNNLCYNSGIEPWKQGQAGYAINSAFGGSNVTIDHNTFIHSQTGALSLNLHTSDQVTCDDWTITNNLMLHQTYGFRGQNASYYNGSGNPALDAYMGGTFTCTNNVLAGAVEANYPANNLYPATATFQSDYFTDYAGNDFTLKVGSPALGAGTSGSDIGADVQGVLDGVAHVISGVLPPPNTPTITNSVLGDGTVGTAYNQAVVADGGVPPYSYAITAGALPSGLSLNASSGLITGTPDAGGSFEFTVTVTDDDSQTDPQSYEVEISEAAVSSMNRFYFPSTGTPNISPAFGSGWTAGTPLRLDLVSTKIASAKLDKSCVSTATSPDFIMAAQYVGPSLAPQTISGTVKGVIKGNENNASFNGTVCLCIRVVDSTGAHKAFLTNGDTENPVASEGTATPPELTLAASPGHRRVFRDAADNTDIPLTDFDTASGDRLVVEIGIRDVDTGTSRSGMLRLGDDQGAADLEHTDGSAADSDEDAWIEFTHDFQPQQVEGGSSTVGSATWQIVIVASGTY